MVKDDEANDRVTELWAKAQNAGITRRKFLTLLAAGGATAVLAACSKTVISTTSTSPLTTSKTQPATTTSAAPTSSKTPVKGGTFKLIVSGYGNTFGDPVLAQPAQGAGLSMWSLEKLLQPTLVPGKFDPWLATSWELAADQSYYTFRLKQGVKFHDGTPFNAQAVKWNLERVIQAARAATQQPPPPSSSGGPPPSGSTPPAGAPPTGGGQIALQTARSVDVIDDYTIKLNLNEWNNMVLFDLAVPVPCQMISPTAYEKNGAAWIGTHPIGTGPFQMTEYASAQSATLVAFKDYWDKGYPLLDGAKFVIIVNPMTQIASLKKGEGDALQTTDPVNADQLIKEGQFTLQKGPAQYTYIIPNATDPASVWSDQKMREALEFALDKESICKSVGLGLIDPFYGALGGVPGTPKTTPRKYDVAKAKQLIAAAGYSQGVKCTLYYSSNAFAPPLIAIQAYLTSVGITVDMQPTEPAVMQSFRASGVKPNGLRVVTTPGGATLLGPSQDTYTGTLFNPDLLRPQGSKELMQSIMKTVDVNQMNVKWAQLEEMCYGACNQISLWASPALSFYPPKLQDYSAFNSAGPNVNITRAWFST